MVLLHLSQLSPQVWQRPYPKQTHTYHMGSAVPLDVVVFILLINSGKAPGSEAELEIFSHCKASHHGHGCGWLSGWEQQSHPSRSGQRVVLSSSPPAAPRYPSRSCLGRYWASRGFSCRTFVWKADQAQATLGISDGLSAKRVLRRVFCSPDPKFTFSRPLLPTCSCSIILFPHYQKPI